MGITVQLALTGLTWIRPLETIQTATASFAEERFVDQKPLATDFNNITGNHLSSSSSLDLTIHGDLAILNEKLGMPARFCHGAQFQKLIQTEHSRFWLRVFFAQNFDLISLHKTLLRSPAGRQFDVSAKQNGTAGIRTQNQRIMSRKGVSFNSLKLQRVAKRRLRRDTNGATCERENAHGQAVDDTVLSRAESLPSKADSFSTALMLIASLPLSDAEKAEAVKRLMAEHAKRGGDV